MNIWFQVVVGLVSVSLFVFCDYTIIRWAELTTTEGIWTWRLFAMLIAAPLSTICFGLVGARMGLAAVSAYINTGLVVGGVLVGVLIRGDQLTNYQRVGLIFGLIALVLINLGKTETHDASEARTPDSRSLTEGGSAKGDMLQSFWEQDPKCGDCAE